MTLTTISACLASRRALFRGVTGVGAAAMLTLPSATGGSAAETAAPHAAGAAVAWRGKESVNLGDRPLKPGEKGRLAVLDLDQMPLLSGVVLNVQRLAPGVAREPHWHHHRSELNSVLEGEGEMGIVGLDGKLSRFPLAPGTVSFVPQGLIHYIANTGRSELVMAIGFNDTLAVSSTLFNALAAFGPNRLAQMTGLSPTDLAMPATPESEIYIDVGMLPAAKEASILVDGKPVSARFGDAPGFANPYGSAQDVNVHAIPHLEGVSMSAMTLEPGALRDIHWHPKGTELIYVVSGELEWGLQAPGKSGESSVFTAGAGHAVAIPEGWLHYAANTGHEPARLLVLWGNAAPASIELSAVLAALPAELTLASAGSLLKPEAAAVLSRLTANVISPPAKN